MKYRKVITWILVAFLILVGVWGYFQYDRKIQYRTFLENQYQNDFYTLLNTVEGIEAMLAKSTVSQSDEQLATLLSETSNNANIAQSSLNRLPISHLVLNETSKFLSQLGDFSYSASKQVLEEQNLEDKQWEDLERLHNNSADLIRSLQKMHRDMIEGSVQFADITREGNIALRRASDEVNPIEDNFTRVEKEMATYPKLIYDGPFSEHLSNIEPKGFQGKEITRKQGREKVADFLGQERIGEIQSLGEGKGVVPTYSYEVVPAGEEGDRRIFVEVSRKGGYIVWMMDSQVVENVNLTVDKALEKAQVFLRDKGFENMVPSYSEKYNGVTVFNFAYQQDDVMIYPDLIKVQVGLEKGEILGFEAQGFHIAHQDKRDLPEPKLSLEQARSRVSDRLDIFKERMAVIPTSAQEEVLCYEFKGTFQEDTFIVYINALTGKEQEILKVIRTNNGDLTM